MASGATNLFLARDTRVFLEQGANIWEIPVLNGYSFSQSTNTSEVSLNEMSDSAGISRRARRMFTDSFAPCEWSFETYIRPYELATYPGAVEEALWANFVGTNSMTAGVGDPWDNSLTRTISDDLVIDFDDSNVVLLGTFSLYFVLGASATSGINYTDTENTTIYHVPLCAINEAQINFDIDGIASINWSGMGGTITELTAKDMTGAIVTGISDTTTYIRNRLTALDAESSVSGGSVTYALVLTGGSITMNNNITYLTPEAIGTVNQPLEHVTGTRSVSGSFTCYMDEITNGSIDLFEDLQGATDAVTNVFDLDFYIGGKAGADTPNTPGVQIEMNQCHLELPAVQLDDVISLDVAFHALPSTLSSTDEVAVIRYIGPIVT